MRAKNKVTLSLAISCSAWVHKCMGAQKKGEGVHWLALACTDLILCAHDLILFYGWYLALSKALKRAPTCNTIHKTE